MRRNQLNKLIKVIAKEEPGKNKREEWGFWISLFGTLVSIILSGWAVSLSINDRRQDSTLQKLETLVRLTTDTYNQNSDQLKKTNNLIIKTDSLLLAIKEEVDILKMNSSAKILLLSKHSSFSKASDSSSSFTFGYKNFGGRTALKLTTRVQIFTISFPKKEKYILQDVDFNNGTHNLYGGAEEGYELDLIGKYYRDRNFFESLYFQYTFTFSDEASPGKKITSTEIVKHLLDDSLKIKMVVQETDKINEFNKYKKVAANKIITVSIRPSKNHE